MKKQFLLTTAILLLALNFIFATVRTVSNDPAGGAQYNSLFAAYNAAVNGDTLLVEGTNLNYSIHNGCNCCSPAWDKSLVVIGAGLNTQKTNPAFRATNLQATGTCNGSSDIYFGSNSSGSRFYGITFTNSTQFYFSGPVSNFIFEDCLFPVNFNFNNQSAPNINFRNCIFTAGNTTNLLLSPTGVNNNGIQIFNCVFNGFINGQNNSSGAGISVDHCLFLSTTQPGIQNFQSQTIRNSIFMNVANAEAGGAGNTFINNISRLGGFSSGTGNLANTNPNFVNYTLGSMWSPAHDYHLQAGSPAIGADIDGTEIGLHGGLTNFNERGEPKNVPIIRTMIINNNAIVPNGTMNVQIKASKPNDN